MEKQMTIKIRKVSNGSSLSQSDESEISVSVKQENLLLTPHQYEEVWKKIEEIKEIVSQSL